MVFALDRGGIVGEDGPTHHGLFDYSYLRHIPNLVFMVPKDEEELRHMIKTAVDHPGPIAFRYPRSKGLGVKRSEGLETLKIGQGGVLREGKDIVIFAIGSTVYPSRGAAKRLKEIGIDAAVINARFFKPLDTETTSVTGLKKPAECCASARPMPELAPVMTTTLPAKVLTKAA